MAANATTAKQVTSRHHLVSVSSVRFPSALLVEQARTVLADGWLRTEVTVWMGPAMVTLTLDPETAVEVAA